MTACPKALRASLTEKWDVGTLVKVPSYLSVCLSIPTGERFKHRILQMSTYLIGIP